MKHGSKSDTYTLGPLGLTIGVSNLLSGGVERPGRRGREREKSDVPGSCFECEGRLLWEVHICVLFGMYVGVSYVAT